MLDNKIGNISIRCIVLFYMSKFYDKRPVSSVAKRTLSEREVWDLTPRPVKLAQCRPGPTLEQSTYGGEAFIREGAKFEIKYKSYCRQKSTLVNWGAKHVHRSRPWCRQRLATAAMFLRSCVAEALSRGDELRPSLHVSAYYREYNEDLI